MDQAPPWQYFLPPGITDDVEEEDNNVISEGSIEVPKKHPVGSSRAPPPGFEWQQERSGVYSHPNSSLRSNNNNNSSLLRMNTSSPLKDSFTLSRIQDPIVAPAKVRQTSSFGSVGTNVRLEDSNQSNNYPSSVIGRPKRNVIAAPPTTVSPQPPVMVKNIPKTTSVSEPKSKESKFDRQVMKPPQAPVQKPKARAEPTLSKKIERPVRKLRNDHHHVSPAIASRPKKPLVKSKPPSPPPNKSASNITKGSSSSGGTSFSSVPPPSVQSSGATTRRKEENSAVSSSAVVSSSRVFVQSAFSSESEDDDTTEEEVSPKKIESLRRTSNAATVPKKLSTASTTTTPHAKKEKRKKPVKKREDSVAAIASEASSFITASDNTHVMNDSHPSDKSGVETSIDNNAPDKNFLVKWSIILVQWLMSLAVASGKWTQELVMTTLVRSHHHVAFSFIFLRCFPMIVHSTIPWAPPWAPVCLWYAFLFQVFCIQGTKAEAGVFRLLVPLFFLLEGVSHHSYLLDLNSSELLLIAFILCAFKSPKLGSPVFFLSLALQCLVAVFLGSYPVTQVFQFVFALVSLKAMSIDDNDTGSHVVVAGTSVDVGRKKKEVQLVGKRPTVSFSHSLTP